MGRRKKDDGLSRQERLERYESNFKAVQKSIYRQEVTFDTNNYVVMANSMILHSASKLNLNELKLLRFIIMQTKKGDKELYQFEVDIKEMAKALEMSVKTLYRELDTMSTHLMQEVIFIGDKVNDKWKKFHWVDVCEYEKGKITIKISDELKPFLVGLRGNFTRYRLSEILSLNSVYAIRIYEILNGYMNENNLPHADVAIEVSISIEEIRKVTDTTDKFERYSNFKAKVIDTALKEINQKSNYHISATPYKDGRTIAGFDFLIESQAGYWHRTEKGKNDIKIKAVNDDLDRQMTLEEFL
ncbi:replication initiation protein [Butyrivibrio sp. AE3004]|uniref:replication initiation protein n=1 Tax=Butyrivibrio sp. AE3004 TaxID=1506994 RepID=UPI00049455DA|nr:replication initiation protein [Butyrivibrio sp. AE3004]